MYKILAHIESLQVCAKGERGGEGRTKFQVVKKKQRRNRRPPPPKFDQKSTNVIKQTNIPATNKTTMEGEKTSNPFRGNYVDLKQLLESNHSMKSRVNIHVAKIYGALQENVDAQTRDPEGTSNPQ